jgi:hypothetical protein
MDESLLKESKKTIFVPAEVYDIESLLADIDFRRRTFLQTEANDLIQK